MPRPTPNRASSRCGCPTLGLGDLLSVTQLKCVIHVRHISPICYIKQRCFFMTHMVGLHLLPLHTAPPPTHKQRSSTYIHTPTSLIPFGWLVVAFHTFDTCHHLSIPICFCLFVACCHSFIMTWSDTFFWC